MPNRRGSVNGPTPSEFSFGRGHRPSMGLCPQPDELDDPLAVKRAQMQVDPTDPSAPLDFDGSYQGVDQWGRNIPNLRERGYTPIVREHGIGQKEDRLDPMNPAAYQKMHGAGSDPNEAWRDGEASDPLRRGWENGNYDPEVNSKTAQYRYARNAQLRDARNIRSLGKRLKIKRTPDAKGERSPLKFDGYEDPRNQDQPWTT